MFGRLFLLFLVVPLVDLALLIRVGGEIGFWPTVAVVVLTAALGSWLARREGVAAWQRLQQKLATGGMPGREVLDGAVILIAGTLLLTPGFLTDLVGLAGLFPPTRALARTALANRLKGAVQSGTIRVGTPFGGPVGAGPMAGAPFGSPFARPSVVEDAEVLDDGFVEPDASAPGAATDARDPA